MKKILYLFLFNFCLLVLLFAQVSQKIGDNPSFVRIHKSFLVNRKFIQEVRPLKVVMLSGLELPLARRRKI